MDGDLNAAIKILGIEANSFLDASSMCAKWLSYETFKRGEHVSLNN